jgi:peptidoglycan-N-acetylglucosamine deacetylase
MMPVTSQDWPHSPRRLALSFDDAPTGDSLLMSGFERTSLLIESLARCGAPAAMFFASLSGVEAKSDGELRLNCYVRAGHTLANHGHAHLALSATPISDYLSDLERAAELLHGFDGVAPFFRHPYLDEGLSRTTHREIDSALMRLGLRRGHVTVKTYDFYVQQLLDEALARGTSVDFESIRAAYVELIIGCVEFYDDLAIKVIGRSPAHVLLLHENDLAALFIAALVAELSSRGWDIVPAAQAYDDPMFYMDPETVFRNQGLIAALAHAAGWKPRHLVPIEEEEDYILDRFRACVSPGQSL